MKCYCGDNDIFQLVTPAGADPAAAYPMCASCFEMFSLGVELGAEGYTAAAAPRQCWSCGKEFPAAELVEEEDGTELCPACLEEANE